MVRSKIPALSRNEENRAASLTSRQRQVLSLIAQGRTNKEISCDMQLAEGTIKVHVSSVFHALHVNNRANAVQVAKRLGVFTKFPDHISKQLD
jgi:DNA-binding NarL/FixJ family response regulator